MKIMYEICLAKFSRHQELKECLLATDLEEGNDWGDAEWGVCNGNGKNRLGKILMLVRMDLQPNNIASRQTFPDSGSERALQRDVQQIH